MALPVAVRRAAIRARILPSRILWRNPFKIVEYGALLRGVAFRPTDVVLDLGCGSGPQDVLLAPRVGRLVGIDVSAREIERAIVRARTFAPAANVEFRCTPIETAGFAPASFDAVVSFSVLEHIVNRDEAIATVFRVLKPGGRFIFSVDCLATVADPALRAKHRADHNVQTYFTPDALRRALEDHGFRNVEVRPLFRGRYARERFEHGIRHTFLYHRTTTLPVATRLVIDEWLHRDREEGLFLCARATKP